jgi:bifunctional DNA-binding transcriptional regulator/antitoxin component of YhaV-PrlF toxin-antitoxin module
MPSHLVTIRFCRSNIKKGIHLEVIEIGGTIILKRVIKFEWEEFKWIDVAHYWEN